MKKLILSLITFLLLSSVMAATLTRQVPSSVNPGQTFTVTYETSGAPSGKWFVAWEDTITGGCTPTSYKDFMASETGGDKLTSVTFTSPPSGSCTFSGYYQFAGDSKKDLPSVTISIEEGDGEEEDNNTIIYIIGGIILLIIFIVILKKK